MLTRKDTWELGPEEVDLFHKACLTDDHSGGPSVVSETIYRGGYQLWVWETERSLVLLITQVSVHPDGFVEMIITMLAGRDVMDLQREVVEGLAKEASEMGCNALIAFIKPELAEKFGANDDGSFLSDKKRYIVFGVEI